ncbi:hypothetical protein C2G38_2254269 [Gigaspora rosea]|uniref:Uncharacterized protein n=1 Tax=Gigaspora rosea TaxID=44941 RepID=A0A397U2Z1_9GLOM|nr:hypothetical protein C2G38_2254269 [Gigaspora rosea]
MSAKSLAKLDESKYFEKFIPHFMKFKKLEKNNPFSCANDDVMDIRGDSGFSKFLSVDEYIKLRSKRPKRKVELPKDWHNTVEEYFKNLDIVSSQEHYKNLWVLIKGRKMEVPVLASKYRRNYAHNHAIYTVVGGKYGKFADLLAWIWETGEEIFVGEQAGPPIKMLIMWKDGVYVYEEYGSLNIASDMNQIFMMKEDILKLLEFMIIIKIEVENTVKAKYNSDMVHILERKFDKQNHHHQMLQRRKIIIVKNLIENYK